MSVGNKHRVKVGERMAQTLTRTSNAARADSQRTRDGVRSFKWERETPSLACRTISWCTAAVRRANRKRYVSGSESEESEENTWTMHVSSVYTHWWNHKKNPFIERFSVCSVLTGRQCSGGKNAQIWSSSDAKWIKYAKNDCEQNKQNKQMSHPLHELIIHVSYNLTFNFMMEDRKSVV